MLKFSNSTVTIQCCTFAFTSLGLELTHSLIKCLLTTGRFLRFFMGVPLQFGLNVTKKLGTSTSKIIELGLVVGPDKCRQKQIFRTYLFVC